MSVRESVRKTLADANAQPTPGETAGNAPASKRVRRVLASWLRWLHIYASMLGLAVTLFFSATGITLNHPDLFGEVERNEVAEGEVNPAWVTFHDAPENPAPAADSPPADPLAGVAKLEIVEHLRSRYGVRGTMAEFGGEDRECFVNFKGPGYSADATIDRRTGKLRLSTTRFGLVAILNDLHKGRDSGPAWSLLVDVSAAGLCFISLTGLGLIFFLKFRRTAGIAIALLGTLAVFLLYFAAVP